MLPRNQIMSAQTANAIMMQQQQQQRRLQGNVIQGLESKQLFQLPCLSAFGGIQ